MRLTNVGRICALCAAVAGGRACAQDGAFRDGQPIESRGEYRTATQLDETEQEMLLERLHRRVSLRLTGATIQEAADVLSRAWGMNVSVDGAVRTGRRVTIAAEYIPVGAVIEDVAAQTGLMIAPERRGVGFRQFPHLEAGNRRGVFHGPLTPWSDDWWRRPVGTHVMDTDAQVAPLVIPGNSETVRIPYYGPVIIPQAGPAAPP